MTDNYGLPLVRTGGGWRVTLAGTNFRPPKGLQIAMIRKTAPLRAALYAAPSGGRTGFFALALTPAHTLTHPTVQISGVPTMQLTPALPSSVKAGQALTVYGRFTGGGRATVTLRGQSASGPVALTQPITFGTQRESHNLASKLWAAHWIEQTTQRRASRAAVIALSLQYTLPSRYTSWLAIPKAERLHLAQLNAQPRIDALVKSLAAEIIAGQGQTPAAQRQRRGLNAICERTEQDPQQFLAGPLEEPVRKVATELAPEVVEGRGDEPKARALRAQLELLCWRTGLNPTEEMAWPLDYARENKTDQVGRQYVAELARSGEHSPAMQALRTQYETWYKQAPGQFTSLPFLLRDQQRNTVEQLAGEISAGREAGPKAQELQSELTRLKAERLKLDPNDKDNDNWEAYELNTAHLQDASRALAQAIVAGQSDIAPQQTALAARSKGSNDFPPGNTFAQAMQQALQPLADKIGDAILQHRADTPEIQQAQETFDADCRRAGVDPKRILQQLLSDPMSKPVATLAGQLAAEIAQGRTDSPRAAALRARLRYYATPAGMETGWVMRQRLEKPIQATLNSYTAEIRDGRVNGRAARRLHDRLAVLLRDTDETIPQLLGETLDTDIENTADDLADKIAQGNTRPATQRLRERLDTLCRLTSLTPAKFLREQYGRKQGDLASELVTAKHGGRAWMPHGYDPTSEILGKPNPTRVAFLRRQMDRLASLGGGDPDKEIDQVEYPWNIIDSDAASQELSAEASKKTPDSQRIAILKQRLITLTAKFKTPQYAQERADRVIAEAQGQTQVAEALHVRMGDPLILVNAPADARQVVALMPGGEVKQLAYNPSSRQWEARFDVPADAAEGDYAITIIAVSKDGTRQTQDAALPGPLDAADRHSPGAVGAGGGESPCPAPGPWTPARTRPVWRPECPGARRSPCRRPPSSRTVSLPWFLFPPGCRGSGAVTFTLTDAAHNRATITAEVAP